MCLAEGCPTRDSAAASVRTCSPAHAPRGFRVRRLTLPTSRRGLHFVRLAGEHFAVHGSAADGAPSSPRWRARPRLRECWECGVEGLQGESREFVTCRTSTPRHAIQRSMPLRSRCAGLGFRTMPVACAAARTADDGRWWADAEGGNTGMWVGAAAVQHVPCVHVRRHHPYGCAVRLERLHSGTAAHRYIARPFAWSQLFGLVRRASYSLHLPTAHPR